MLFQVTGIKPVQGKQENISCVIEGADEAAVRDFCSKNSIAIFELKPYLGQRQAFGQITIKVAFANSTVTMVIPYDKAKDAYMFYTKLGFKVTYINNYTHRMSDEDVAMVVKKLEDEYEEEQKKLSPKEHLVTNTANVVLQKDPELEKMKQIATQAVNDMEELKSKTSGGLTIRKVTDLKELEDELKKTRMGSNIPKMRSLVSDAYKLMEEIEMAYLDQQKAAETNLIADSVVTHLDLVREYEKYEKALKVKKGNLEKTPSDMYYIFFGKTGMYQRFLSKDLEKRIGNRGDIIYSSIDYLVMFIFMCIVWLTITALYQHYVLNEEVFIFTFVDFALIGLILIAINKLKKRNIVQISILFGVGAVIYFFIRYLLITNFAL